MYDPRMLRLACCLLAVLATGCQPDKSWHQAFDATATGWMMNTWGTGRDDRFAAGGSLSSGAVMHFDGQAWTPMQLPDGVPLVNWVFGFAPDDVHAVGNDGTILHYDGSAWSLVDSPTDQDLWGVWGAGPNDLWSVGGSARHPATAMPTLIHFDGTQWTNVDLPTLSHANVTALFKVWGSGPDDVYAVGQHGTMLHWDGSTWSDILVGAEDDLISIWGTGPNDIVAVGGRSNGIVARFDGTEWHSQFLTPMPGLNGVWMGHQGIAHVVGLHGTLATLDANTLEVTDESIPETHDFHAIFGVDGVLTAVGGNLAFPATPEGIAYYRDLGSDE